MSSSHQPGLVLAVHPTSRGFGWMLFEGPLAPNLWAISTPKKAGYGPWCMKQFEKLLDQYRPHAVVLEYRKPSSKPKSDRAGILSENMRGFASNRGIDVHVYSRAEVAALVSNENAKRSDVVEAVAKRFPILCDRLPSKRKRWQAEDGRRCLFDAAALGIAHYRITRRDS